MVVSIANIHGPCEGCATLAINSTFDIVVQYTGDPLYQSIFQTAADRWEQVIIADLPDVNSSQFGFVDDLRIDASVVAIDGVGNILGQAGPDEFRNASSLPYHGEMEFDSADVAAMYNNGTLYSVVLHEIGHILGLGTLWSWFGLINTNTHTYTGAHALAEYRLLTGNSSASSVPLESGGGSGTRDAHWSEAVFNTELMTGFAEGAGVAMPLSRMTIAALWDLGYVVNLAAADAYGLPGSANLAPVITSNGGGAMAGISIVENSTTVTTVTATDANAGTTLSYSILTGSQSPDAALFNINAATGALTFKVGPDYEAPADADHNNSYIVQVRVSDGSLTDIQTLTVNIANNPFDGIGPLAVAPNDFNGDGLSDILWQNTNGMPAIWQMSGTTWLSGAGLSSNPGPTWHMIDSGDFDGDRKADILWQNDNGQPAIWLMDGYLTKIGSGVGSINPGPGWNVVSTGDFNGDGRSDILWQADNGQPAIWLMNGLTVIAEGGVGFNPGPSWHVIDAGDFNHDGRSDILWQNANGQPAIWLMNGLSVIGEGGVGFNPSAYWNVVGAGDFNGDKAADILWQSDGGLPAIWLMDGLQVKAEGAVGSNSDPSWHVLGTADFNGDGKSDIQWQHDGGTPAIWLMDGFGIAAGGNVGSNPGSTWHVI